MICLGLYIIYFKSFDFCFFQIFITDGLTRQNILAEYFHYADDYEKHCSTMTVGDMNGATLVFESSKGTLGFYEDILNNTEVVYMKDIDLKPGSCNGKHLQGPLPNRPFSSF